MTLAKALCTNGACVLLKFSLKLTITLCLMSLSGCSTTKPTNIACDFVGGAVDNANERYENKNNQNSDVIEGILNIFGGMLTRNLNNDSSDECT
jgi:hypothetical protein